MFETVFLLTGCLSQQKSLEAGSAVLIMVEMLVVFTWLAASVTLTQMVCNPVH